MQRRSRPICLRVDEKTDGVVRGSAVGIELRARIEQRGGQGRAGEGREGHEEFERERGGK